MFKFKFEKSNKQLVFCPYCNLLKIKVYGKYCSRKCYDHNYYNKNFKANKVLKLCQICHKNQTKNKYCSVYCRNRWRNIQALYLSPINTPLSLRQQGHTYEYCKEDKS